ncbi:MAG: hypothetical protein R2719_14175 [Micropruina sp.]
MSGPAAAEPAHNVWLLLIVYAVQQACLAVNQLTRRRCLSLLPLDQLPAANSLNMTVMSACTAGLHCGASSARAPAALPGHASLLATPGERLPLPVRERKGRPARRSAVERAGLPAGPPDPAHS